MSSGTSAGNEGGFVKLHCLALLAFGLGFSTSSFAEDIERDDRASRETQVLAAVLASRFSASATNSRLKNLELDPQRIYFLTRTPAKDWGDNGRWEPFSAAFHQRLDRLPVSFHPENEAWLVDRCVYRVSDGAEAWMLSIHVAKWINEGEAEIEQTLHRSPYGPGGMIRETWVMEGVSWKRKRGSPVMLGLH